MHVTVPSSYGMTAVLKGTAEIKRRYSRSRAAEPRGNLSRRAPPVSQRLTALRAAQPRDDASSISSHLLRDDDGGAAGESIGLRR